MGGIMNGSTMLAVERAQRRYRRACNGPWAFATTEREFLEVLESDIHLYGIGDGLTITWPDGVKEAVFPGNGGVGNYPPVCIPNGGRYAQLLKTGSGATA